MRNVLDGRRILHSVVRRLGSEPDIDAVLATLRFSFERWNGRGLPEGANRASTCRLAPRGP